jgi:hypothetical protein
MNRTFLFFIFCLSLSYVSYGQYGGQYGGMGRQGMGGMGGGQFSQQSAGSRPSAFSNMPGILADRETKWLKDSLSLSKDQVKAVKKLNNEYAKEQQTAIKDIVGTTTGRPTPEMMDQIRETMVMINEEKEDGLKGILSPEQWTLYRSKKESMVKSTGGFKPKVATVPQ